MTEGHLAAEPLGFWRHQTQGGNFLEERERERWMNKMGKLRPKENKQPACSYKAGLELGGGAQREGMLGTALDT